MDERAIPQKEANLRHAARCLSSISATNQPAAKRFIDWKVDVDRRSTTSATFYSQHARDLDLILKGRPYHEMTPADGEAYRKMRAQSIDANGLANELARVRHFLKWQIREHVDPDLQQLPYRLHASLWIRETRTHRVKPEDPLTPEEKAALMEVCEDEPDSQALYDLLWDGGPRIGESLVLNWREYRLLEPGRIDLGANVHVPDVEGYTKTDDGTFYVLESVPTMMVWHDLTPLPGPDDPIFTTRSRPYRRATYRAVWGRLQHHLKKAGLRSNIHFHLFRKTEATRRAPTMDPDTFRKRHRWKPGSKVASEYIMNTNAAEKEREAVRAARGVDKHGRPQGTVDVGLKTCPFCAEDIKAAAVKCKHCGEMVTSRPTIS